MVHVCPSDRRARAVAARQSILDKQFVQVTAGNCFRARRTGNAQDADGRLEVRGYDARAVRANLSP